MIGPEPRCFTCVYYNRAKHNCKAFPKGIPDEIGWDGFDHKKPYKGDNGIRYKKGKL